MGESSRLLADIAVSLGLATPEQVRAAEEASARSGRALGEELVASGVCSRERLAGALLSELGLDRTVQLQRPPIGDLLVGLGHITQAQLDEALAVQRADRRRLGEILVEQGHCTYRQVYEALSLQARMAGTGEHGPAASAGRGAAGTQRCRVLVVDDSPLACQLVEDGLVELGYEVLTFQDPFEALEQVPHCAPAIVLTDLDMPGMDGAELCRRLKEGPARAVPVVILTANDGDAERVSGLRAGADDYVNKSASMAELAARIDGILRRTGETERIRKLFARYTSDAVVEEILKSGGVVLTGEKREVTVLFADIRNFTAMAESLSPERVVGILNDVFGCLSDAVLTCGGTLDKFLGDGLMAVFGAPVFREDDAVRALQAAQMMMDGFEALNRAPGRAAAPLQLGIGINSGTVVAGNVGSPLRTEYTCIGDAVNVASRLCAVAGPGEILVGERTVARVGSSGRFEELAPVRLKGKAQPVPLFRVVRNDRQSKPDGR